MLDRSINELKGLLTDICTEGNILLQKFQASVPNSNLKRLESMIPRLNEASTKLIKVLTPKKNPNQSLNAKRGLDLEDEDDNDLLEMKPAIDGYKKVEQSLSQSDGSKVILVESAFSIKFICHADIQGFMTPEKQYRFAYWSNDGTDSSLTIKREDFATFPSYVILRMSKEHAKITATKNSDKVNYELTDLSVNGIHYLGNRIDGMAKEKPVKLQKGIPFRLKDGDWICLLLKKDVKGHEALLGFEFSKN